MINIKILTKKKGNYVNIKARKGSNLLKVVQKHNAKLLEGACGGNMICSTCHIHILSNHLKKINKKTIEESEILSLANNLKKNSRLACQIEVTKKLEGLIFCIA